MNRPLPYLVAGLSLIALPAMTQAPSDAQCRSSATQATGYTPGQATYSGPDGDRARGAARGAAAGAVVGEVQGDRYGRASNAAQDQHRENQARSGAAAGVAVGGSRNRQERRGERRSAEEQQAAWQRSYDACMAGQ